MMDKSIEFGPHSVLLPKPDSPLCPGCPGGPGGPGGPDMGRLKPSPPEKKRLCSCPPFPPTGLCYMTRFWSRTLNKLLFTIKLIILSFRLQQVSLVVCKRNHSSDWTRRALWPRGPRRAWRAFEGNTCRGSRREGKGLVLSCIMEWEYWKNFNKLKVELSSL